MIGPRPGSRIASIALLIVVGFLSACAGPYEGPVDMGGGAPAGGGMAQGGGDAPLPDNVPPPVGNGTCIQVILEGQTQWNGAVRNRGDGYIVVTSGAAIVSSNSSGAGGDKYVVGPGEYYAWPHLWCASIQNAQNLEAANGW